MGNAGYQLLHSTTFDSLELRDKRHMIAALERFKDMRDGKI